MIDCHTLNKLYPCSNATKSCLYLALDVGKTEPPLQDNLCKGAHKTIQVVYSFYSHIHAQVTITWCFYELYFYA